eukprot:3604023-Prymnesium_polylepis.1
MQSSHLSFQEYFAATAICSGKYRLPKRSPPPWQWPVSWANAVAIGAEMGEAFGHGLLRAAGVEDDTLDDGFFKQDHNSDFDTSLRVVCEMARALKKVELFESILTFWKSYLWVEVNVTSNERIDRLYALSNLLIWMSKFQEELKTFIKYVRAWDIA